MAFDQTLELRQGEQRVFGAHGPALERRLDVVDVGRQQPIEGAHEQAAVDLVVAVRQQIQIDDALDIVAAAQRTTVEQDRRDPRTVTSPRARHREIEAAPPWCSPRDQFDQGWRRRSMGSQPDEARAIGCRDHDGLVRLRMKGFAIDGERGVEAQRDPSCALAVIDLRRQRAAPQPYSTLQSARSRCSGG